MAGMIVFHIIFDLRFFWQWPIEPFQGKLFWLGRTVGVAFLLLSGISFTLARQRMARKGWTESAAMQREFLRACRVYAAAFGVTVATFIVLPAYTIQFGVLHLIATSTLLLPLTAKLGGWNIIIGTLWTSIKPNISSSPIPTGMLLPFGFPPENFRTLDYYPLLPWHGVLMIGQGIGTLIYGYGTAWRRTFSSMCLPSSLVSLLTWPGRHSLLLYLIHQPIILAALWFILGPWPR